MRHVPNIGCRFDGDSGAWYHPPLHANRHISAQRMCRRPHRRRTRACLSLVDKRRTREITEAARGGCGIADGRTRNEGWGWASVRLENTWRRLRRTLCARRFAVSAGPSSRGASRTGGGGSHKPRRDAATCRRGRRPTGGRLRAAFEVDFVNDSGVERAIDRRSGSLVQSWRPMNSARRVGATDRRMRGTVTDRLYAD
jgi:hypothetical protein